MSTTASEVLDLSKRAKLPARQAGGSTVAQFFETHKASMAAVLPKHVSPDRMLRIALGAIRTTPQLMDCTTESLFGAVVQCAQLGLEPNTPLGHAYLIPFANRKAGRADVQVIVGYRGLLDLARRSGQIVSIAAHAVRDGDEFFYQYGLDEQLVHRPASGQRGEITHVYAVAKLVGGGHAFEVMERQDVDAVMKRTQSKGAFGPWKDHYEEMARKTAIRRLFKYLPVSIEAARAAALDGLAEAGEPQDLSAVLSGEWSVIDADEVGAQEQQERVGQEVQPLAEARLSPGAASVISDMAVAAGLEELYDLVSQAKKFSGPADLEALRLAYSSANERISAQAASHE